MSLRTIALALTATVSLAACQPAPTSASPEPAANTESPSGPLEASTPPAAKPTHPALVVETLDHGRFDVREQRGQWVVVNFWATWCAPCVKEIPELNALDAGHGDVSVVGLAYEEITPEAMRAFYAAKVKPEYPIAIIDVIHPPADFGTPRGLPFTVLLDPDGAVAHQFLGPVTAKDILDRIARTAAAAQG